MKSLMEDGNSRFKTLGCLQRDTLNVTKIIPQATYNIFLIMGLSIYIYV